MSLISLSQLRTAGITHAVSLGGECVVAYNLRRYYGFSSAYPFDWWIAPLGPVITLIRGRHGDDFYRRENLKWHNSGQTIIQIPTQIWLHHEFPRDWAPGPAHGKVYENFHEKSAAPRERTAYLFRKLFALNAAANRILFVRKRAHGLEILEEPQCAALCSALEEAFGAAQFGLLLVNHDPARVVDRRPGFARSTSPSEPLRAANVEWDDILGELNIPYENAAEGRFSDSATNPELDTGA